MMRHAIILGVMILRHLCQSTELFTETNYSA